MAANNFKELYRHYGHEVVVAQYTDQEGKVLNAAIECNECYEVLMDYEKEEDYGTV